MIKCIAIDDEPLALRQMENYIQKTPFLELLELFDNALDAYSYCNDNEVELMFVDINMPDLSGMDFVKSLENTPMVIFTTAYSEYAVEGFKVDAVDYLLKPISYPDFLKSAQKAENRFQGLTTGKTSLSKDEDFLFIKSDYKLHRISFSAIRYIEGMREYVRIHLEGQKPIMPLISIKKLESKLPENQFMRVHRSYIINLEKITTIERNRIMFDDKRIPVSEQYKEKFQKYLDDNFLL